MALLKRKRSKQNPQEREALRARLRALEEQREDRLASLGATAAEMHRRESLDPAALREPAAEIAALEDEIKLVRRGLDEGVSPEELDQPDED